MPQPPPCPIPPSRPWEQGLEPGGNPGVGVGVAQGHCVICSWRPGLREAGFDEQQSGPDLAGIPTPLLQGGAQGWSLVRKGSRRASLPDVEMGAQRGVLSPYWVPGVRSRHPLPPPWCPTECVNKPGLCDGPHAAGRSQPCTQACLASRGRERVFLPFEGVASQGGGSICTAIHAPCRSSGFREWGADA